MQRQASNAARHARDVRDGHGCTAAKGGVMTEMKKAAEEEYQWGLSDQIIEMAYMFEPDDPQVKKLVADINARLETEPSSTDYCQMVVALRLVLLGVQKKVDES
jgi:hypothetical protein